MKTFNINLLVTFLLICSFPACEDDDSPIETHEFEANFHTVLAGFVEDAACAAPKSFLNTQEGGGSATMLGDFTTTMTFCVDPTTFEYDNAVGSFVATDGNEIYFEGSGQVLPSDREGYDLEFHDTITIVGGTGPYAGATGELSTDSYVKNETQRTDHVWSGTIILVK